VTSDEVIGLIWEAGASNGGSIVIDYKISYAAGDDAFVTLDSGITILTYEAINLIAGAEYKFKI
jgi:hypothetical protein